jgi:hypothetical protein
MSEHVSKLMSKRRWCYWVPADGYVEGQGYRVSIVFEYEAGHYPSSRLSIGSTRVRAMRGSTN